MKEGGKEGTRCMEGGREHGAWREGGNTVHGGREGTRYMEGGREGTRCMEGGNTVHGGMMGRESVPRLDTRLGFIDKYHLTLPHQLHRTGIVIICSGEEEGSTAWREGEMDQGRVTNWEREDTGRTGREYWMGEDS
ncbi:hypothetical protein Pmani_023905 [Petrolisthes manimaculis]|uniref:Uncharacterized protein n=1 Tax=Petrolisthes manimaculis TaxID=1843537 RepID=A0AAE1PBF4_9EUCA|nr:hypothetical protein Pmani_023905 [Petrolisthes manimaculis]